MYVSNMMSKALKTESRSIMHSQDAAATTTFSIQKQ